MIDHSMSVSFTTSISADNRFRTLLDQTRQRLVAELHMPTDLTSNRSGWWHLLAESGVSAKESSRRMSQVIPRGRSIFLLEGITFFRYAFSSRGPPAYDQSFGAYEPNVCPSFLMLFFSAADAHARMIPRLMIMLHLPHNSPECSMIFVQCLKLRVQDQSTR